MARKSKPRFPWLHSGNPQPYRAGHNIGFKHHSRFRSCRFIYYSMRPDTPRYPAFKHKIPLEGSGAYLPSHSLLATELRSVEVIHLVKQIETSQGRSSAVSIFVRTVFPDPNLGSNLMLQVLYLCKPFIYAAGSKTGRVK